MTKCIMHIGMHKTGSTSIQSSLKRVDDNQFYYAQIGIGGNHSVPFATMFANDRKLSRFSEKRKLDEDDVAHKARIYRRELSEALDIAGERTLIVSGEAISMLSRRELKVLQRYFEAAGRDVEIIAYVRTPGAYMSSAMQHKLTDERGGSLNVASYYPQYKRRFDKFDDIFGNERVKLFKFAPQQFPEGDVVADFCSRLDIPRDGLRSVRRNDAMNKAQLRLLYQYRQSREARGLPRLKISDQRAWEFLASLDQSKFRIAPDLVKAVLAAHAADIEWMEQRLGESLAEDLGEARPDDYRSEADLLAPIPGARERLTGMLRELGGEVPGIENLDVLELLSLWAELVEMRHQHRRARARKKARGLRLDA